MNIPILSLALFVCASPADVGTKSTASNDVVAGGFLRIERGPELLSISIPRDEELQYDVLVDVGVLGNLDAGDVTLSSGAEAYVAGLPPAQGRSGANAPTREAGWVRSFASGGYLGYTLKHELIARHLPQEFPAIFYKDTQSGSENRRRELRIGAKDGAPTAVFRSDGHCKGCDNKEHFVESKWLWGDAAHCKKCKELSHRVWKDPVSRTIPAGTVDMLSAVYLARGLVRDGVPEATIPTIDRQKVWNVHLTRGARKRVETDMGKFDCQQVVLTTTFVAENETDEEKKGEQFQGLFGIQGKLQIWMEASTGVPVLIEGDLPVPIPLVDSVHVQVRLKHVKNVPAAFKALK